jgi:hypothetical protein
LSAAVLLLSAAVLAHEVCLLRVLAVAYYSHAASLVVSVALLGFGAAGTLLALVPALRRPSTVAACAGLYAAAAPLCLRLAGAVDFNVLEVGWDPAEWLGLLALQAILMAPFLLAALGIAVALALRAERAGGIYAMNLLGSGAGALAAAPLLMLGAPEDVLSWAVAVAAAGALLVPGRPAKAWGAAGLAAALLLGGGGPEMSSFKDLPSTPGKRVVETRHGPLGRVDLVETPYLHHAPGLSLGSTALPPEQQGLYVDGHRVGARDLGPSDYLDDSTGALPFLLVPARRVLLLGVGPDLSRATTVVEANADLLELSGAPGRVAEPRAFLEGAGETYDLIVHHVSEVDPVRETPLLTVGGLRAALGRATEEGGVAVSCRLATPPRAGLKLLLTAERATRNVVAVRSLDRVTVFLGRRPVTEDRMERVRRFCERQGFDIVRPVEERPERPRHETGTPLLDPGPGYPFDVRPATDARPYFHRFFRWTRLPDLARREAVPFVQWTFVSLLAALVLVVTLTSALLLAPLALSRAARAPAPLFLALGLGFMLLEMGFLARANVRIGSPAVAAATVLGGFLVGSGLGSLAGERLGRPLRIAALAAALMALPGYLLLPGTPLLAAVLCGVVAFPMGMPFPAALSRLGRESVPWALAVNGFASVTAAAAAPLVSSTFGIPATVGAAAVLYALVASFSGRR